MARKTIRLFMWGFQHHFRSRLKSFTEETLAQIGFEYEAEVILVGVKRKGSKSYHPVCIEPEYQKWGLDIFEGIIQKIDEDYKNDPNHRVFYSNDEIAMREKPEKIMRYCITSAISESLKEYDNKNNTQSFCGTAYPVDDYYVVPVIQIETELLERWPFIDLKSYSFYTKEKYNYQTSLVKLCITELLEQATIELSKPNPGKGILDAFSKTDHVIPSAAKYLLTSLYHSIHANAIQSGKYEYMGRESLFDDLNKISSLSYEGQPIEGKIIIFNPEDDTVHFYLKFKHQVSVRNYRWIRKLLHMTTKDISLISDGNKIYGLGCLNVNNPNAINATFFIEFLDHYDWCLYYQDRGIIRSVYDKPMVTKTIIEQKLFIDNFVRIFPNSTYENQQHIWDLVNYALCDLSGCMLVIVDDAENEAKRLAKQSTPIEPILLTKELLTRVRRIDGSILLDYTGMCYAIGVILDGDVNLKCSPARGSRYNSAMRYVYGKVKRQIGRLAIIISDDKSVEVEPLLRPKISEKELDIYINRLEGANADNYWEFKNWLDKRRFYINKNRCERINKALIRLNELPLDDFSIRVIEANFTPDPEMEKEYFK